MDSYRFMPVWDLPKNKIVEGHEKGEVFWEPRELIFRADMDWEANVPSANLEVIYNTLG